MRFSLEFADLGSLNLAANVDRAFFMPTQSAFIFYNVCAAFVGSRRAARSTVACREEKRVHDKYFGRRVRNNSHVRTQSKNKTETNTLQHRVSLCDGIFNS